MTYMASYMRIKNGLDVKYSSFVLVQTVWGITQGLITPFSGFVAKVLGLKMSMYLGCFIFCVGTATSYFTLESQGVWPLAFTYGGVQAFGEVIALIPPMTIAMRLFPNNKGLATGLVVGGFGGGSFVWNQLQTAIINPGNLGTNKTTAEENCGESCDEYFTDEELLNRVPYTVLYLGLTYLVITFAAITLIKVPSEEESVTSIEPSSDRESLWDFFVAVIKTTLTRREFYLLWITRFCYSIVTQAVSGFYKSYGLTFGDNLDHYLSTVGALSSLFNCVSRVLFGFIMDRTSYRTAVLVDSFFLTILVLTLPFTKYVGIELFTCWIWGIYLLFPAIYALQPVITNQIFGPKYGGTVYGLLFTCDLVLNPIYGYFSPILQEWGGYLWYFVIMSIFGLIAFLVTCFFPNHRSRPSTCDELEPR